MPPTSRVSPRTARARPVTLWQIGVGMLFSGQPTGDFAQEPGNDNNPPGALNRADDFYCAGTFPTGFNSLPAPLTVTNQEPNANRKRALTSWHTNAGDRTNRVHFILSATQTNRLTRFRIAFELLSGGGGNGGATNASTGASKNTMSPSATTPASLVSVQAGRTRTLTAAPMAHFAAARTCIRQACCPTDAKLAVVADSA